MRYIFPTSYPVNQPFSRLHHADKTNQILVVYAVEINQRFLGSPQTKHKGKNTKHAEGTDIRRNNGASHHATIPAKLRGYEIDGKGY